MLMACTMSAARTGTAACQEGNSAHWNCHEHCRLRYGTVSVGQHLGQINMPAPTGFGKGTRRLRGKDCNVHDFKCSSARGIKLKTNGLWPSESLWRRDWGPETKGVIGLAHRADAK